MFNVIGLLSIALLFGEPILAQLKLDFQIVEVYNHELPSTKLMQRNLELLAYNDLAHQVRPVFRLLKIPKTLTFLALSNQRIHRHTAPAFLRND